MKNEFKKEKEIVDYVLFWISKKIEESKESMVDKNDLVSLRERIEMMREKN